MSEKPILFVSHSSNDGHIANVIKEQLEAVLDIEVFETSHFSAIEGGKEWFEVITQKLDAATALLVLASYNSRFRQWVHWEIGYFYKKSKDEGRLQSIYIATVAGEQSFNTVQAVQMKPFNDVNETAFLLQSIGNYFGFNLASDKYQSAVQEILKIIPVHFSDESAKEKLRDFLNSYKTGIWIDYDDLDTTLHIPSGFSKNHIKLIIQEDNLNLQVIKPSDENEKGIRLNAVIRPIIIPNWDDINS